ncbi:L-seryl-tRNA(Sec) kinase [Salminus brasiliensis]|uniref:L-seryl-tRNA(Sec) kinase n=1 Tax=Salminus brasiliensis TaxID=930266 RepID=UPI003B8360E1
MAAAVSVCVLCGLPASGKSSLAQVVSAELHRQGWRTLTVSYDLLISEDAFDVSTAVGDEDCLSRGQTRWRQHRQAVLSCLESFLQDPDAPGPSRTAGGVGERFSQAVVQQNTFPVLQSSASRPPRIAVLLDDNFYYQSMRYEVYQLARKYSTGFCQVYLHCPVEVCVCRNQGRGRPVSDEVIVEMSKRMESPNPARNHWEESSLTLDSTDITDSHVQKLVQLMCSALQNPLSPVQDDSEQREADRERCASSVVHQADQACRRLVSQAMLTARERNVSSEVLRVLARDLSEQKGRFLQELRRHVLQELPMCEGEPVDVERVVSRALTAFQQQREDVLERHGVSSRTETA